LSETIQQTKPNKHNIVVSEETYKRLLNEGTYSDTMDKIISRILLANEKRKEGQQEVLN
jgi:hypothetical protein